MMMKSTILPQPGRSSILGSSRRGRSGNGTTASTKRRSLRESSKRGPVARRANRRAQAAQWRPAPVVPELVASQPPAPDPYLAYSEKVQIPVYPHPLEIKSYKPKAQHERFGTSRILSLLSSAFGNITVLVPTSRPLFRPGHRQIL